MWSSEVNLLSESVVISQNLLVRKCFKEYCAHGDRGPFLAVMATMQATHQTIWETFGYFEREQML